MLSIHFTPAPGSLDSYATFASKHKKFVDICTDTSKVQAPEDFLCASMAENVALRVEVAPDLMVFDVLKRG